MHLGFLGTAHLTRFSLFIGRVFAGIYHFLLSFFKFHWIAEFHESSPTASNWVLGIFAYIAIFVATIKLSRRLSKANLGRFDKPVTWALGVLGVAVVFWPLFIFFTYP